MQRTAQLAGFAFGIAGIGFRQRVGIEFDDGIEHRPRIVDPGDAIEV